MREQHVAPVRLQLARRDDPQPRDREHADRDLEQQPDPADEHDREPVVVAGLDEDVEVVVVEVLQELDGPRQHDEVAERDAGQEQERDHQHQRERDLPLARARTPAG